MMSTDPPDEEPKKTGEIAQATSESPESVPIEPVAEVVGKTTTHTLKIRVIKQGSPQINISCKT